MLEEHRHYLTDKTRVAAYRRAIQEVVKPGAVVLDLGAGTGILGLLCCQAGAHRVYCIDRSGMIEIARAIAPANNASEKLVFINDLSLNAALPERVDLVVADQIGGFGFEAGLLEYFSDARSRFLKPEGVMMPSRVDLWIAPVECSEMWSKVDFWNRSPAGCDFSAAFTWAANTAYPVKLRPEYLLGDPARAVSLVLTATPMHMVNVEAAIVVHRPGQLHGIGGWFNAALSPSVMMSNSPLISTPIDRMNVFYPVQEPLYLREGDRITIQMKILPASGIVSWSVSQVPHAQETGGDEVSVNPPPISQSTWKGLLVSREQLSRSSTTARPALSPHGKARLLVLHLSDGQKTLAEIEDEVYLRHGGLFRTRDELSRFVTSIINDNAL